MDLSKITLNNYHKHSTWSNVVVTDSVASIEDYAIQAVKNGGKILSSLEHGWQGKYHEVYEIAKKHNLKFVFGVEAYWVKDRLEKDRTNSHICIFARNESGRKQINKMLSIANTDGYYYQARVDLELLLDLNPNDVLITTACIAFWHYEDIEDILVKLHNHFKKNLLLEIQYHNSKDQIELNKRILSLSNKYDIAMIVGLDSHYINEEQKQDRLTLLEGKGIKYEDSGENEWYMDYPDNETVFKRFQEQNVLGDEDIKDAMFNTFVFEEFEDIEFTTETKMVSLYPNLSQTEKNDKYRALIIEKFKEYIAENNLSKEDIRRYLEGIKIEMDTVIDTDMTDYFLFDYELVEEALKDGGVITPTGRGCFTKEAIIQMADRTLKNINEVQVGDYVIDMNGDSKKVLNTFVYDIHEVMIEIQHKLQGNVSRMICTLDHKIYVFRDGEPQWIEAQNLQMYDYLMCPKEYFKNPSPDHRPTISIYEDYLLLPVQLTNTFKPKKPIKVYDFEVEDTHSYLLYNAVVHNSGVSFFTNTLLGFSKIDRFASPIHIYPERFMSRARILETKALPDLDLNLGNPEVFAKAQTKILGEDHSYPMIAFGFLKTKSAFKMYAKAKQLSFDISNEITKQITAYEMDYKYAKDNTEEGEEVDVHIEDYVEEQYLHYIEESKTYLKVINNKSPHPCAYLVTNAQISEEIGLIMCKSESTGSAHLTTVIDGSTADKYGYLKNDLLKVDVVMLNQRIFEAINKPVPNIQTLLKWIEEDGSKVWDIYAKGITCAINQVEQQGTINKVKKYQPRSLGELACFVAAIRPSFKSLYHKYERREDFSYGIPSFDSLLQTKEVPQSFIFFQEQIMKVLSYGGIPMDRTYDIIKAISKKKIDKVYKYQDAFLKNFADKLHDEEGLSKDNSKAKANEVWGIVENFCGYGFNACLSGNTRFLRNNNGDFRPTIEEMYKIKNDKEYAKNIGKLDLHSKYKHYGYGKALSMNDKGIISKNDIIDIRYAGFRKTYRITLENGEYIDATSNHKFPISPTETKKVEDLIVGDSLYVKQPYQKNTTKYTFTNGDFISNVPKAGQQGFQSNNNGASVKFNLFKDMKKQKNAMCEICGGYHKRFEAHHKDFDRTNNDHDNLQWLCPSCHKKIHYAKGRTKQGERGELPKQSKIISIEYQTTEDVYDVEMKAPNHNFVIDNGIVTSNSHALAVAMDGLYGAYLKSSHTLDFYTVALNYYSESAKKLKIAALKKEAQDFYNIKFLEPKFGHDNRQFNISNRDEKTITQTLGSIKRLGTGLGEYLYNIRHMTKNSFYEVLEHFKNDSNRAKPSSAELDILIKLDYFSQYGKSAKLLEFVQMFNNFYAKKTFKKDGKHLIDIHVIAQYCKNETEKQYREFDYATFLSTMWNEIPDKSISLKDRFIFENEYIGSHTYTDIRFKNIYFVDSFETKYSASKPTLILYSIETGENIECKVKNEKKFNANKFGKHSFIELPTNDTNTVINLEEKYKIRRESISKDSDLTKWSTKEKKQGYRYVNSDQKELILINWNVIK